MVLKGYGPLGDNSVSEPLVKYRYITYRFSIVRKLSIDFFSYFYKRIFFFKADFQKVKKTILLKGSYHSHFLNFARKSSKQTIKKD